MNAYLYRLLITVKRRPVADIFTVVGIFSAVMSVIYMDRVPMRLFERDEVTIQAIMTLLLIICFDYAFAVGFRSGVLGYNPADMTFQFAAPFSRVFNLFVSFPYGLGSVIVFLWLLAANSPVLSWWVGATSADMAVFTVAALFVMLLTFFFTSFISARYCDNAPVIVLTVAGLLVFHAILITLFMHDMTLQFGSFETFKARPLISNLTLAGNSVWALNFPVAGWVSRIIRGVPARDFGTVFLYVLLYLAAAVIVCILYRKGRFDFYETACLNTGRILEVIEASKAGVEAVNTGIARTATVGNEVFGRGWGASAFFHMHLFENRRTSKLFFINKVAAIYRVFALLVLLLARSVIPDGFNVLVIIIGMTTMMVLNAIVFGGGKTVLEFGRPFFFLVPQSAGLKLSMCILADLPEMAFDAVVCALMIKFAAWEDFGLLPFFMFIFLMIAFDLLSQTTGIICAKVLRQFGKFPMMFVRYVLTVAFLLIGMLPSTVLTNVITAGMESSLSSVLGVLMGVLGGSYLILWAVLILVSRRLFRE